MAYSYVGQAALDALNENHADQRTIAWKETTGTIQGDFIQTPPKEYWGQADVQPGHSDFLPQVFYDNIIKAERWVDISSLSPPAGKFMEKIRDAIAAVGATGKDVTIRMIFSHVPGAHVDTKSVLKELTSTVPEGSNVKVWLAAYRKGFSWNHSKICAVDGTYLMAGGHNYYDVDYLMNSPVHDISMRVDGQVTYDAHRFLQASWKWLIATHSGRTCGCLPAIWQLLPEWMPCVSFKRVDMNHFPEDAGTYPPSLPDDLLGASAEPSGSNMIAMGRHGSIGECPSDTAITAMLGSAQQKICMSLQDLGPLTLPASIDFGDVSPMPGGKWPKDYFEKLADAMTRGVQVNIVLSQPLAGPVGGYGYGWTSADVCAELLQVLQDMNPDMAQAQINQIANAQLKCTYITEVAGSDAYPDGIKFGNHAKFFCIDDKTFFIASQNLYICNLAEWGMVVDDPGEAQRVMDDYFNPMFAQCTGNCVLADDMIARMGINRTSNKGESESSMKLHFQGISKHQYARLT